MATIIHHEAQERTSTVNGLGMAGMAALLGMAVLLVVGVPGIVLTVLVRPIGLLPSAFCGASCAWLSWHLARAILTKLPRKT